MKKISDFKESSLISSCLQKIFAGKELATVMGPAENPAATDIHYDNDNDGVWSKGDQLKVTLAPAE